MDCRRPLLLCRRGGHEGLAPASGARRAQSRSGPPALFASWLVVRRSCSAADFAWEFCIDPTVSSERASTRARVWRGARLKAQRERPELAQSEQAQSDAPPAPRESRSTGCGVAATGGSSTTRRARLATGGAGRMWARLLLPHSRAVLRPPAPETGLRSFGSGGLAEPVEVTGPCSTRGLRPEINPLFNPRADDTGPP